MLEEVVYGPYCVVRKTYRKRAFNCIVAIRQNIAYNLLNIEALSIKH